MTAEVCPPTLIDAEGARLVMRTRDSRPCRAKGRRASPKGATGYMAKRISSRDRIERLRIEAAMRAKERAEKKSDSKRAGGKRTASRAKRAEPPRRREKLVWKVFDGRFREVACFPYAERAAAEAKAVELTEKGRDAYFVNAVRIPLDES